MSETNFKFTTKRFRISFRLQYIIFPFTAVELMSTIAKSNLGYVLAPPPKGNAPIGISADWAGIIAKKGTTLIDFDSVTQLIGVDGADSTECTNVISELLDIIHAWLEPELDEKIQFYELIASHSIQTGKNPLESLRNQKFQNEIESSISQIMGYEYSNFSIHLSSPLNKIDDPTWHDIRIQPQSRRPDKEYDVLTVYRKLKLEQVVKFTNSLEENIAATFKKLELV